MREEDFTSLGGRPHPHALLAARGRAAGGRRDLPRRELARRPARLDRRSSSRRRASRSTPSTCAAAASPRASGSTSRTSPSTSPTSRGLIAIAKERHPGLPVYLLGHSAGGVVSCTYALDHQDEIDGLICESFAFQVPAPGFVLSAIKGLSHIAPRLGVLTLKMKDFTRDPVALKALEADPLTKDETQPAATVAALVRADERLHDIVRPDHPAGADPARHRRPGDGLPGQRVLPRARRARRTRR